MDVRDFNHILMFQVEAVPFELTTKKWLLLITKSNVYRSVFLSMGLCYRGSKIWDITELAIKITDAIETKEGSNIHVPFAKGSLMTVH